MDSQLVDDATGTTNVLLVELEPVESSKPHPRPEGMKNTGGPHACESTEV